jgi:DNA-binding transcriptional LysR family regulator
MNTKQLKLFILVADIKSFSKAAEHEALTQPAVTQQIMRLERETGSVLLKRKNKSIEMTKRGKLFYKFAKNMLSMVDSLEKELRNIDSPDEGILKIGSSHIPTSHMLYEKIAEFKKKYPKSYIIYEINDTENISFMVENEMLDMGFVGAITDNNLDYRSFSGDELKLVARKDFDIAEKVSLAQLKEIPLIINQKESGVRKFLADKLVEYGMALSDLNIISEIGLPEALLSTVRMGMGCGFVPSIIVNQHIKDGDLKVVEIKNFSAYRDYYMITKKNVVLSSLARTFLESFKFQS